MPSGDGGRKSCKMSTANYSSERGNGLDANSKVSFQIVTKATILKSITS